MTEQPTGAGIARIQDIMQPGDTLSEALARYNPPRQIVLPPYDYTKESSNEQQPVRLAQRAEHDPQPEHHATDQDAVPEPEPDGTCAAHEPGHVAQAE